MPDTQNTSKQSDSNKNSSYVRDGNDTSQPIPFTQLSDHLIKTATQYDADGRKDRAAGIREAAALFDQSFKTFQDKNVSNIPASSR